MNSLHDASWAAQVALGLMALASVGTWAGVLLHRWFRGPLLSPQPWEPVPWSLGIVIWAGFLWIALRLGAALLAQVALGILSQGRPEEMEWTPAAVVLVLMCESAASLVALLAICSMLQPLGARKTQMGWNLSHWRKDVLLGGLIFLLAVLPVYGVFFLAQMLTGNEELHPLLEALEEMDFQQDGPALVWLTAGALVFAVVVVAPLVEEFLFRGVLQAWAETALMNLAKRSAEVVLPEASSSSEEEPAGSSANSPLWAQVVSDPESARSGDARVPWWPGWLAVAISATVFAVAHWGHGVAPAGIWVLGVFLGLLYQRTRRLLPAVVAHAAFNAWGLGLFFLQ